MAREMHIGSKTINDESPCYVIAEVGHNHQGNLDTCKAIFRSAKECGCDAVKLQKRDNKGIFTREMYDSPYLNRNSYAETYGEHREFLEFGLEQYEELKDFCSNELNIDFFATAFDEKSADLLKPLDLAAFKIASGDLVNTPLLVHVASMGKPMIISTGGAKMSDVERAYKVITAINPQLCIMQCTSGYPAAFEDLNLRVIEKYRETFEDVVIGYSGHENGISAPLAAYVLGARIVEKHFTLDRSWKGTDQALSLSPNGMRRMVRDLKRVNLSLGGRDKAPIDSEKGPLKKMAKSLVAARPLSEGTVLTANDMAAKSPSVGLPPYFMDELVGKTLCEDLETDQPIMFDHVK